MEKVLLIIDDSKEIIDVVKGIIGGLFDRVEFSESVEDAQNKLEANVFSYMVLDINLKEGRNGAEVLRFLVENPENKNNECPVVILSGIITAQFIEKFNSKFAGIVTKPFDHDEFVQMTKDILDAKESANYKDIPTATCELPFTLPVLEAKVSKVMEQVRKNTKLKELFHNLNIDRNADNYIMSHVGMLINASTAIAMKMEWNTEKTLEKFVYAAYLHDMALAERPDLARIKATAIELELMQEKMTPADHKLVLEHALIAANTIDGIPEIPADVGMIVRQHHELPKENGFPNRLSYVKITPLSSVFIVAHDLTHYILENPKWTVKDYVVKAKNKFKGPHFAKVLSALSEMN
ncbi:MAG: response regulator [Bacteriovorax sp.]|nr:response regulator [Bacteriovorax sp.]